MADQKLGMSPDDVARQREIISGYTAVLTGLADEIDRTGYASHNPVLAGLFPGTMILTAGSIFLAQNAAADVREAAAAAQELLVRLSVNITEQIDASSATDGYLDGVMSKAQADALYEAAMKDGGALAEMTPLQIRAWWDRLTDVQKEAFVTAQHWTAGNTNGIPFDVRIEANALSAREMLRDTGGMSPEQVLYLEEVRDGSRSLVSFDPSADRIVEMIGTFDEKTTNIVNYVPGTTADMDGFYNLETQQMGSELVAGAIPPGSTVVFVYKDSPFPTFDERGVYHSSWAASVGEPYHDFNTALGFENPGGIPVTSIEHSFGSSVGGYAEIQGTVFDQRIVLGGIGMTDEWQPNPGTEYYSFTGEQDVIRAARERYSEDLNTGYPHPPTTESGFIERDTGFVEPAERNPWVIGIIDPPSITEPLDQHTRVAGVEDNQVVLDGILEILR